MQFEHFFKPEIRRAGDQIAASTPFSLSGSDTEIQAYVRGSTPCKVLLKSRSFHSAEVLVSCSCSSFKRGQFCKHIWATLALGHQKFSDFFDSKSELVREETPLFSKNEEQQISRKLRESAYRKAQYEKQKLHGKKKRSEIKPPAIYPPEIAAALQYFSQNGFSFSECSRKEDVGLAKKKLARVFHPDRGGTHEEILTLHHYSEILIQFLD